MKRADVLDRNLRHLLRRAYAPVRPSPAFRDELKARVLAPVPDAVGATDAMRSSGPAPRVFGRAAAGGVWRALAAAAVLLVGAAAAFLVRPDPPPHTREAILARGEVALRDAPVGDWFAADDDRTRLPRGGFLQVATPAATAHAVDVASGGRLVAAPASALDASAAPADAGEAVLQAWLTAGAVDVTHPGGDAWTIESSGGIVSLDGGAARIADTGPAASVVSVRQGAVTWHGDGGATRVLAAVSRWRLLRGVPPASDDESVVAPARDAAETPGAGDETAPEQAAAEDDASPPPAPSLSGAVSDGATDLPVRRFAVSAVPITLDGQPAYGREPIDATFDDADGAFALFDLEAGTYKLFVSADGYATWRSPLLMVGGDAPAVRARLDRGGAVAGKVVDAATGRPVAGAFVFSQSDAPALLVPVDAAQLEPPLSPAWRTATTDADGRFVLTTLSPGAQRLRASKRGFAPTWVDVPGLRTGEQRGGVELALRAGGGVRGDVRLEDGAPLARVPIIAMPQDRYAGDHGAPFGLGVTGEDGAYTIPDLPPGMHVLVLLATLEPEDLGSVVTVQPCRVAAEEWTTVDFGARRDHRSRLFGRLADRGGAPLPGLMLTLSRTDTAIERQEDWVSSTTDADGRFSFDHVDPGPHALYLVDATGGRVQEVGMVEVPPVPEHRHDLTLPDGLVAGRVVEARTGEPLPFSLVMLVPDDGRTDESITGKTTCDAAGAFRFRFVAPGPYRVRAIPARRELGTVDAGVHVDVGGAVDDLELRAAPGAAVVVSVTDGGGQPVAGARVRVFDETGRPFATAWNPTTDGAGERRIEQLPPGTWTLEVARGAARGRRVVALGAGDEARVEIEIETEPSGGPPDEDGG